MKGIGGNKHMQLQIKTVTKYDIGEHIEHWETIQQITGWLDLQNGDSKHSTYDSKIQESTHIFIADYVPLALGITAESSRAIIDGKVYDIMLIDNPMEMNLQLEIYLKYTGGQ
jgi:head-tail adaptor